jgi:hypothetical protein
MITFYPRDIGLWRRNLSPIQFSDRDDLLGYCKENGVRLDDTDNPFSIFGPEDHPEFGPRTFTVKQWTVLGWIKDEE